MEVSRGANLVEMSMMPLDACPFSLLIKKKLLSICVCAQAIPTQHMTHEIKKAQVSERFGRGFEKVTDG